MGDRFLASLIEKVFGYYSFQILQKCYTKHGSNICIMHTKVIKTNFIKFPVPFFMLGIKYRAHTLTFTSFLDLVPLFARNSSS